MFVEKSTNRFENVVKFVNVDSILRFDSKDEEKKQCFDKIRRRNLRKTEGVNETRSF